jgi:hypothetical protein
LIRAFRAPANAGAPWPPRMVRMGPPQFRSGLLRSADDSGSVLLPAAAGLAEGRGADGGSGRLPDAAHVYTWRYGPDPAMRIRDPLPHRRTRHLTDIRANCQGNRWPVPPTPPQWQAHASVRHCPQWPVGNLVGIRGHLYAVAKMSNSLFPMDYQLPRPLSGPFFLIGCAQQSTEFSQLVHRVILCG